MPSPDYLDYGMPQILPDEDEDNSSAFKEPRKMDTRALDEAIARRTEVYGQRPTEPQPKWWQRLAAGAAGGLAGYVNSSGRMRPVDVTPLTEEILAPGHKRRLRDWMGQVETAEAGVKGEEERQQAQIRQLQAESLAEQRASMAEERAARVQDRRLQREQQAEARTREPGVEEIVQESLETTVPSTVPGIPGQQISVAKPEKRYLSTFEHKGKRFGKRTPEDLAQEQQRITQAGWLPVPKALTAKLGLPEDLRVPPGELDGLAKLALGMDGGELLIKDSEDKAGNVTFVGISKRTGQPVTQVTIPKIGKGKETPASMIVTGGMTPEQARRTRGLQQDFDRNQVVKVYPDVRNALDTMKEGAAQDTGVGDIALMRAFAKLTDPSTGVREEEYRAMQGASGALKQLQLWISGEWVEGKKLHPDVRKAFLRMAQKVHDNRANQINSLMNTFRMRAEQAGVDSGSIFGDLPELIQSGAEQEPAKQPVKQQPKVGDTVNVGGKKVKIKKIYPDGTFDVE